VSAANSKPAWLFVTDPWDTLDHGNDTTFRIMEAAAPRRIAVFWCDLSTIRSEEGQVVLNAHSMALSKTSVARLDKSAAWVTTPRSFQQIHYRVDPPVDLHYLQPLQMLAQVALQRIVNPAHTLVLFSEKTLAAEIPELFPTTCVSSSLDILTNFIQAQGQVVMKPLHLAQSKGVTLLRHQNARSVRATLKKATENFTRPILLQEFLPEVGEKGETRLWFVDGKLLAAVQKVPARGQFIIDMDQGGSLAKAVLTSAQRADSQKIGAALRKHRIRLAAVDWIGGKITDFNVTSPGLIVAMEKLLKQNLADRIVRSLMKKF